MSGGSDYGSDGNIWKSGLGGITSFVAAIQIFPHTICQALWRVTGEADDAGDVVSE